MVFTSLWHESFKKLKKKIPINLLPGYLRILLLRWLITNLYWIIIKSVIENIYKTVFHKINICMPFKCGYY